MDDRILDYRTAEKPKQKRTRWWLVLVLLLLTPVILIVLTFILAAMGVLGHGD
jgi:hypothetical protein